jgi:hypothetical protein
MSRTVRASMRVIRKLCLECYVDSLRRRRTVARLLTLEVRIA